MRPETATRIIMQSMKYYLERRSSLNPKDVINPKLMRAIDSLIPKYIKRETFVDDENGTTLVPKMYYADSLNDVESTMDDMYYISDRWKCAGRLMFFREAIMRARTCNYV